MTSNIQWVIKIDEIFPVVKIPSTHFRMMAFISLSKDELKVIQTLKSVVIRNYIDFL